LKKSAPKNYISQQNIYYLPSEFKVSDLLKEINIAGLTLPQLAIDNFNIRLK
jgi:hypothetical protein